MWSCPSLAYPCFFSSLSCRVGCQALRTVCDCSLGQGSSSGYTMLQPVLLQHEAPGEVVSSVRGLSSLLAKGGTRNSSQCFRPALVHAALSKSSQAGDLRATGQREPTFPPLYPECPLRSLIQCTNPSPTTPRVSVSSHFLGGL